MASIDEIRDQLEQARSSLRDAIHVMNAVQASTLITINRLHRTLDGSRHETVQHAIAYLMYAHDSGSDIMCKFLEADMDLSYYESHI